MVMKWKYIFNTTLSAYNSSSQASEIAREYGYYFFVWGNSIHHVTGGYVGIDIRDCY